MFSTAFQRRDYANTSIQFLPCLRGGGRGADGGVHALLSHIITRPHNINLHGLVEWYEPGNYGQEKCGDDEVSEQRLEAEEEALLLQETVEGVGRQLLRLGHAVPRGKGLLERVVVAGGGEGVGQGQLLGEAGQGALLQVVQRVRVERYAHDGCEGRTYGDDKERVGKHELGIDLLYDEDTKGDDQYHHSQTAEEHREVKHLVGARGGDAEVEDCEVQSIARHPPCDEKAEPPTLPTKPPETYEAADGKAGNEVEAEAVGMDAIDREDGCQVGGRQGARRAEEQGEEHVEVAEDGLPTVEYLKVDVGPLRGSLFPDKESHEKGGQTEVGGQLRRGKPVEDAAVSKDVEKHQHRRRDDEHAAEVELPEWEAGRHSGVSEAHEDEEDGDEDA